MEYTVEEVKKQIVEAVKREYANNMVNMFEGNASARVGDRYFITPSQVSKEKMNEDMVIEVDKDGNIVYAAEGLKPSSELFMHLEVYKLRPDVNAVIHNHSLYATAFAMNNMPIESDCLSEINVVFGTVPVVPYGTPGTDRIFKDFDKYIGNLHGMLLANHGLIVFGKDIEMAYSYAESIEKLAQTIYLSKTLGEGHPIPKEEVLGMREFGNAQREKEMH